MNRTSFKSQGITAFGVSMVLGGIALLLSVAMLGLGTQSALANGVGSPLAQGTQPIPQLTPTATVTAAATVEPTATTVATGTAEATTTATAVGTVVATGTVEATTTAVGTVVGTVVTTTTPEATVAATSTSIPVATTEPFPTEGAIETATPISVGMPSTGSPLGDSGLTLALLIIGVMMTTIGLASLAARKRSYKR